MTTLADRSRLGDLFAKREETRAAVIRWVGHLRQQRAVASVEELDSPLAKSLMNTLDKCSDEELADILVQLVGLISRGDFDAYRKQPAAS